jgi:hypothetical protein
MPIVEPCGKEDKRDSRAPRAEVLSTAAVPGLDPAISQSPEDPKGNHNEIGDSHQIRVSL